MRPLLRVALASLLILAAVPARRAAAEWKPVVVASLASVERLLANVDALGTISQTAVLTDVLKLKIREVTHGIDPKKPCAVVIFMNNQEQLHGLGFVPVTDFKRLATTVAANETEGGVFEVGAEAFGHRLFLKERKGWACFGLTEHLDDVDFEKLPADLSQILGGQETEYDVAVRVLAQNIPPDTKKLAVEFIQHEMEKNDRRSREPADDRQQRRQMEKQIAQWIATLIEDLDRIMLGWTVDAKGKRTYLDFTMTTRSASPTAKMFATLAEPMTSKFAGFAADEAAIAFQQTYRYPADLAAMMRSMLGGLRQNIIKEFESGKTEDDDRLLQKPLAACLEVLEDMYASGVIDAAAGIFLKPGAASVVYGLHVESGAKVEAALRDVAEWVRKKYPDWPQPNFNADKHRDVRLHTIELPVPDSTAASVFGEITTLVVGCSDKNVYVSAGKESLSQLKAALDRSEKDRAKQVLPTRVRVAAGPIFEFASATSPNPVLTLLADAAAKYKGKDQLLVTLRGIDTGFLYRIELEEGFLALAGKAILLYGTQQR